MGKKQKISFRDVQNMVDLLEKIRLKIEITEDQQTLTGIIGQLKKLLMQTTPVIGKKQLAEKYDLSLRSFIALLRHNEECYDDLILSGYRKNQKVFSPRQMEIINQYFG